MRRLSVHLAMILFSTLMLYWLTTWLAGLIGMAVALHAGYQAGRLVERASTALAIRKAPVLELTNRVS